MEDDNGKQMKHRFGAKGYRDFLLINDKNSKYYLPNKEDRDKVKRAYKSRHRGDKGLNYRKALRDLPSTVVEQNIVLDADLTNVTFPTAPS